MTGSLYFHEHPGQTLLNGTGRQSTFVVGLDLGQAADFTALAVVERIGQGDPPKPPALQCRHLDRYPLGTLYPDIVTEVGTLLHTAPLQDATLLVDATGVGRGICDMFKERGIDHKRVIVTGGDNVQREGGYYRVPKRDLVSATQAALQDGRLQLASDMPLVNVLVQELLNFRVKISDTGHDSYNAWRENEHDDLLFALMLACWWAARPPPRQGSSYPGSFGIG